jgi:hypothetical protein
LVSCNYEVGEDAGVGGTHGVGEEADVGGAGQQTCVAVVTYVVWQRAVPLRSGYFGAKRFLTGSQTARMALLPSMTQLSYWKLRCARMDLDGRGRLGVRLMQLLTSVWQLAAAYGG